MGSSIDTFKCIVVDADGGFAANFQAPVDIQSNTRVNRLTRNMHGINPNDPVLGDSEFVLRKGPLNEKFNATANLPYSDDISPERQSILDSQQAERGIAIDAIEESEKFGRPIPSCDAPPMS